MICIFTAMYCEAEGIIARYGLKRSSNQFFDVYESDSITLIITGIGKIRAATAVSHIISSHCTEDIYVLNIGCACGTDIGRAYIASSIEDKATGRQFFPDLIYNYNLSESKVITVDKPVTYSDENVYDMEASGIVQSASCYVGPDKITVVKIVSDDGSYKSVTTDTIKQLIDNAIDDISVVIDNLIQIDAKECNGICIEEFDRIAQELKCSEYMRGSLRQLMTYAASIKVDVSLFVSQYLPITDRRRGKEVLDELRQYLTT